MIVNIAKFCGRLAELLYNSSRRCCTYCSACIHMFLFTPDRIFQSVLIIIFAMMILVDI